VVVCSVTVIALLAGAGHHGQVDKRAGNTCAGTGTRAFGIEPRNQSYDDTPIKVHGHDALIRPLAIHRAFAFRHRFRIALRGLSLIAHRVKGTLTRRLSVHSLADVLLGQSFKTFRGFSIAVHLLRRRT